MASFVSIFTLGLVIEITFTESCYIAVIAKYKLILKTAGSCLSCLEILENVQKIIKKKKKKKRPGLRKWKIQ